MGVLQRDSTVSCRPPWALSVHCCLRPRNQGVRWSSNPRAIRAEAPHLVLARSRARPVGMFISRELSLQVAAVLLTPRPLRVYGVRQFNA